MRRPHHLHALWIGDRDWGRDDGFNGGARDYGEKKGGGGMFFSDVWLYTLCMYMCFNKQ